MAAGLVSGKLGRMNTGALVLSFLLWGLAVAPPSVGSPHPSVKPERVAPAGEADRVVARLFDQLDASHQEVLNGEWSKAGRRLDRIEGELVKKFVDGPDAPRLLGQLSLLRALADAGRGELESASWHYAVACSFLPALDTLEMGRYGVAGEVLAAERARWQAAQAEGDSSVANILDEGVTPPRKLESPAPRLPRSYRALCSGGFVIVRAMIDASGKPTRPGLATEVHPMLAFAALRTLREWRFAPAGLNGRPVAVWYNLSVKFAVQGCEQR
jgi:hypothetical protein